MKQKKKWVIPLCVIGVILLLCAGGLCYMINHSMSFSVGRCLVADNGSYMFIDGNSPIIMSNRKDKEGLFSGLGTGDKILIFHDGIAETIQQDRCVLVCEIGRRYAGRYSGTGHRRAYGTRMDHCRK